MIMSKLSPMERLLYFFVRDNYIEVGSEKVYLYRFYPPNLSILTKREKDIEIKRLSDFLDAANIPIQMFGLDKVEDLSKNIEFFDSMEEQYSEYTQQIVNELTTLENNSDGAHSVQRAYYFVIRAKTEQELNSFKDAVDSQNMNCSEASKAEITTVLRNFFLREFSTLDIYSFDKEVLEKYESSTNKRAKKS